MPRPVKRKCSLIRAILSVFLLLSVLGAIEIFKLLKGPNLTTSQRACMKRRTDMQRKGRGKWLLLKTLVWFGLLLTAWRATYFSKLLKSRNLAGNGNHKPRISSTEWSWRHTEVASTKTVTVFTEIGGTFNDDRKQDIFGIDLMNKSDDIRKDACLSCFVHDFEYVIENVEICTLYDDTQSIDLLVVICTTHDNKLKRDTLRNTWLTPANRNTANVRYVFLLGETHNVTLRQSILKESENYGDIIKEDFVDSYGNLTYKTIMGMQWATTKCSVAKYFMKTDDDVYVNLVNVLKLTQLRQNEMLKSLAGECYYRTRPIRTNTSKWFVSKESYPHDEYPGYCYGVGYITSLSVVRKITEVSSNVPFFHIEDVYIGLCLQTLGFSVQNVKGFYSYGVIKDPCFIKGDAVYAVHGYPPSRMETIWKERCERTSNSTT